MTTAQQELYDIIARIEPEDAVFILNFIKRFVLDDDVVTGDDLEAIKTAREEYRKGEIISLADYDKTRNKDC